MPSLRERLGALIAFGRQPRDPIAFHPMGTGFFGVGIGTQPTHETLLRENIGIADTATRAIANRLASLNPQVKISRRLRDGTMEDEILDDHVLKALLDRPHPNYSGAQLRRLTGQYLITVGEAYWLKVGNRLGVPTELHPIPVWMIEPILSQGIVTEYMVTDGRGKKEPIPVGNVVRVYLPDPESPWTSEGYLGPSAIVADSLKFAGQHLRAHYQHDATPKAVLEATESATPFDDAEEKRFYARWKERYHQRWGSQVGTPGLLPVGYKLVELALQTGGDIQPLLEYWRDEQLMAFGTPRSILGQVVSGDRSSAETNQYVFDLHTVLPLAKIIEDALTYQLATDFDPALFVEFEPFVSEDKVFKLEQEKSDLTHKVRSPNMVLEARGEDPVSWGEMPVGKLGDAPYDPDLTYIPDEDEPEAFDEGETPAEELEDERRRSNSGMRPDPGAFDTKEDFLEVCVPEVIEEGKSPEQAVAQCNAMWDNRARGYFSPEAEEARQAAHEKAYTPSFARAMQYIFGEQKRAVLKAYNAATPRARVTAPEIFDPTAWDSLFQKHAEPVRYKAFETVLSQTLAGFGIDEFVLTDEMRLILQAQGAALVRHANHTTQKMIAKQLDLGAAKGESVDQIAKRIRKVFRVRRKHARTIARTEVLKANQEATLLGYETSGVVRRKQWNTSKDAEVRDSHAYADGQIRDLPEPFDLAGELADAPGVGAGHGYLSAENAINCRCFVTPVLEE